MRLDDQRESSNYEDRRGQGGGGGFPPGRGPSLPMRSGGMSAGMLIIVGLVLWLGFGVNPLQLLGMLLGGNGQLTLPGQEGSGTVSALDTPGNPEGEQLISFSRKVLATTEDSWAKIFAAKGYRYEAPRIVFYAGTTRTGCGQGQEAMGPFYCPADRSLYFDLDFFHELKTRFGAPGEFAAAYVIAHEVGHHVQFLLGTMDAVDRSRRAGGRNEGPLGLSVRLELQADCYAGVWARVTETRQRFLDPGDIENAMRAAAAVGDDRLGQSRENFTHGSAEQRMRWFKTGFESGAVDACDTFSAGAL